ncbi:DUF5994 family protein [Mycolicibacterium fortuitum]|uniref:DUF5994 family protein n=1 Tax=Mycolicibacterium fortuitum TaxID=1766 RepID=UPI001CDD1111|nr:DUF5994 family protein [Mycolicibacterium fortuitum]
MTGLVAARRSARPVRVALAQQLGADVDGGCWPFSESLAGELVDLVAVLQQQLGDIVDIWLNWSDTDGQLDLDGMAVGSKWPIGAHRRRPPRLIRIAGRNSGATLLVVPPRTSPALGALVMRCAASTPVDDAVRRTPVFETAERVLDAALLESARWLPGHAPLGARRHGHASTQPPPDTA